MPHAARRECTRRVNAAGVGFLSGAANLRGMALVFVSTIGFSLAHGIVRHLSVELHAFEIAFFRNFFGALVLVPLFLRGGLHPLRTQRFGLNVLRVAIMAASLLLFFHAIAIAPLAKVIALGFTGPIFATLLAPLVLRERVGPWRWSAIAAGFVGALIVVRPGYLAVDTGTVVALASSVLFGIGLLLVRVLGRRDSAVTLTAWSLLLMMPFTLLPALPVWRTPEPQELAWLAVLGVLAGLSLFAFTAGLRAGEIAVVLPCDYFRLVWAAAIGYLAFGQVPDAGTWIGGTIIFAGACLIAWREYRARPSLPSVS